MDCHTLVYWCGHWGFVHDSLTPRTSDPGIFVLTVCLKRSGANSFFHWISNFFTSLHIFWATVRLPEGSLVRKADYCFRNMVSFRVRFGANSGAGVTVIRVTVELRSKIRTCDPWDWDW